MNIICKRNLLNRKKNSISDILPFCSRHRIDRTVCGVYEEKVLHENSYLILKERHFDITWYIPHVWENHLTLIKIVWMLKSAMNHVNQPGNWSVRRIATSQPTPSSWDSNSRKKTGRKSSNEELTPRPLYSPDLAPADFHLFHNQSNNFRASLTTNIFCFQWKRHEVMHQPNGSEQTRLRET